MTSLETARVIGLMLLASKLVLVYFAAWIVCLRSASLYARYLCSRTHSVLGQARDDRVSCIQSASLNWMLRASPCRRLLFSCRHVSPDC